MGTVKVVGIVVERIRDNPGGMLITTVVLSGHYLYGR